MSSWVEEQQSEIDTILDRLGVEEDVKERFKREKIYASTVKLLGDQELEELGLCMGDRATIREMCGEAMRSRAVSAEVRSILSPLPSSLRSGTSPASTAMIQRRSKGKGKSKLAVEKYGGTTSRKGRKPAVKFQKKLVVIDYMGPKAPRSFGLKESYVLMRGMLPEIEVCAGEEEVRETIMHTMKDSEKSLAAFDHSQFQLMEANGKTLCVPAQHAGFEWTGRAVKELSGSGAVYVRLTSERQEESSTDSNSSDGEPDVKFIRMDPPGTSGLRGCRQSVSESGTDGISTPESSRSLARSSGDSVARHPRSRSMPVNPGPSPTSSTPFLSETAPGPSRALSLPADLPGSSVASPSTYIPAGRVSSGSMSPACSDIEDSPAPVHVGGDLGFQEKVQSIAKVLPDSPLDQLKFLLRLSREDVDAVTNFVLEGVTLSTLLDLVKSHQLVEGRVRRLEIAEYHSDPRRLVEEAVAFYKSSKFHPCAELRICIEDQPVIDVGGVRRQFLSDVFAEFCTSKTMRLFEGPKNRLRPVFRQTSISSGLLTLVGKMVGHSIVMDGVGFPFLSPCCYYYMAGHVDRAFSVASVDDAGEAVKQIVSKLVAVSSEEQLQELACDAVVFDLMEQSGCDLPLKMDNVAGICDAIIVHDVLHKRKVFLDCFGEGLEVFSLRTAINAFPDLLEGLFVSSDSCSPEDVLAIVKFSENFESDVEKSRVAGYFKNSVRKLEESDLKALLRCVTGNPYHQCNFLLVDFSTEAEEGFNFGTCGNRVTISTRIQDEETFMLGLMAAIGGHTFTLP